MKLCIILLFHLFFGILNLQPAVWGGLMDASPQLQTSTFSFTGTIAESYDSNENYYDGDFADFDGDGWIDRGLGSRFGLLKNNGGGKMIPYAGANLVNYLFRGLSPGWGEDAFQWADVDNDGDMDIIQGGNGEPFTLQINSAGRFRTKWVKSGSALNIVNIDIENDGDVDLAVAHAFCSDINCGHGCPDLNCGGTWPKEFHLWVNDGAGNFTDQVTTRGFGNNYGTNLIVGVVAGDIDNDRDFDLILLNGIKRGITVARNNGYGNFTLTNIPFGIAMSPIRPMAHGFSQAMNLGDIDNDGDLDLVMPLVRDSAGSTHPRVGHAIFVNNGTGNFSDQTATRFDATESGTSFLSADNGKLVDLDYDGDFDFIAFDFKQNRVLQVFFNDGTGRFVYSAAHSRTFLGGLPGTGTGADTDVTDINGDGSYDLWIGAAGSDVRILLNSYRSPDGLPANQPRNFRLEAATNQTILLAWNHPPYADISRSYNIYRANSPDLARNDKTLLKRVTISRHQDEGFAAPLTAFTTTAYLNDPAVRLETNTVYFSDTTALAGVTYFYSVTHVGTENTESAPTPELQALLPSPSGPDLQRPQIEILSPTAQDWASLPRIVLQFGDGESGINLASLRVSLNAPLGNPALDGRAAGADLADLAFIKTTNLFIAPLMPPLVLPTSTLVTLTATIEDNAGNRSTNQAPFFVSVRTNRPPAAVISVRTTNVLAGLPFTLAATNSIDPDSKLFRAEWYFEDGGTAIGPLVKKQFSGSGQRQVRLLARDTSGAVAMTNLFLNVSQLVIQNPIVNEAGFQLTIPTLAAYRYTVEYQPRLDAGSWQTLTNFTGTGNAVTVSQALPESSSFFRVKAEP